MRSPVVVGGVAGLVVGMVLVAVLVVTAVSQPPAAASPGPSPRAVAIPTLARPTGSPLTTATAQPSLESTAVTSAPEGVSVGEQAPTIVLPALRGGTVDAEDYAGRPLWINFMATWCPSCQDELPMMQSIQEQLGDDLMIVIVDVGEDERTVRRFMESLGVTLPVGLDTDTAVQHQWGEYVLPVHYRLDADGVIRAKVLGPAPPEIFVESVRTVVPGAKLQDG